MFVSIIEPLQVVEFLSRAERRREFAVLCAAVNSNQFPCSMIKGGAEIVNSISQDERQIGGRCLAEANLEGLCASLRIIVDAKRIGVCLYKSIQSDLEIADVLLGPLNLKPSTIKPTDLLSESEIRLRYGEETENSEGYRHSHPKAGRLLQKSEESRHTLNDQPKEEVAAQTAPSHPRGGCTATHTHLGTPEDAS